MGCDCAGDSLVLRTPRSGSFFFLRPPLPLRLFPGGGGGEHGGVTWHEMLIETWSSCNSTSGNGRDPVAYLPQCAEVGEE